MPHPSSCQDRWSHLSRCRPRQQNECDPRRWYAKFTISQCSSFTYDILHTELQIGMAQSCLLPPVSSLPTILPRYLEAVGSIAVSKPQLSRSTSAGHSRRPRRQNTPAPRPSQHRRALDTKAASVASALQPRATSSYTVGRFIRERRPELNGQYSQNSEY